MIYRMNADGKSSCTNKTYDQLLAFLINWPVFYLHFYFLGVHVCMFICVVYLRLSFIQIFDLEKDLGVDFDCKLSFDLNIQGVVGKANQMVGVIKGIFKYLDREIFL